jgi:hypothetical protein
MCTLTLFPKPQNKGFILTFSRDETPNRSSIVIQQDVEKGLIYPQDALHGGTWLAFQPLKNRFVCLLNGAFEIHKRQLPYRKSRGLVVLEAFDYEEISFFCTKYDFEGIEPFTMILSENDVLMELRWDGIERHIKILDKTTPHIWSSCTLYNKDIRQLREQWFSNFLKNPKSEIRNPKSEDLWSFHLTPNDSMPENAILMQRPSGVQTVSISQLNYDFLTQKIDFKYHELGKYITHEYQFDTRENPCIASY